MKHNEKRWNWSRWNAALLCGLILSILISMTGFEAKCETIRGSLLRLHVIANSDSQEDQALKLKVRDRLIAEGALLLDGAKDEAQAVQMAQQSLPLLQQYAQDEIAKQGYH